MIKTKLKNRFIYFIALLIILINIVSLITAIIIYKDNFGNRSETPVYFKYNVSDFDGLKVQRHIYKSNNGQNIVGYTYYKNDSKEKKAVIVMAHGMGSGGQNRSMNIADYFASNGYYVFSYDVTGNGESEGKSILGLPQGLIDLDYSINYIKKDSILKDKQILLYGHSWGAYSVSSVLSIQHNIKGVVSASGFNGTLDILNEQGKNIIGNYIDFVMPYIYVYERFKFGKYASYTSLDGYQNSNAKIMIIHSSDDNTISQENSFDVYYNKLKNNNRFTFIKYSDRGHNNIFYSNNAIVYTDEFNNNFMDFYNSFNGTMTVKDKTDYMLKNLDKSKAFELDKSLMNRILDFYNTCLQ